MTTGEDKSFLLEQAGELEEILELMPGDVGTLNSLVYTYLQMEDADRASQYALQLRSILVANGDFDQLKSLAGAYLEFAPDNQVFQELAQDSGGAFSAPAPVKLPGLSVEEPTAVTTGQFDLSMPDVSLNELCMQLNHELELGEFLKREGLIADNVSDQAVESLIQNSSDASVVIPLTLLTELSNIEHINMQRIYGVLSQKTNTPFIKLSQFEVSDDLLSLFDLNTAKRLGIVPFAKFENEVMIAFLNPFDETLKETLSKYLNIKLHFYLTGADEIQKFYDKVVV